MKQGNQADKKQDINGVLVHFIPKGFLSLIKS
jgi:hypothetical protein